MTGYHSCRRHKNLLIINNNERENIFDSFMSVNLRTQDAFVINIILTTYNFINGVCK